MVENLLKGEKMKSETTKSLSSWELPDPLWEVLKPLMPVKKGTRGRYIQVDFRTIFAGIFFVLRTGIQWQACPRQRFGPPSTVYYYFRWACRKKVFEKVWNQALQSYDELKGLEWEWQSVDGAMTKAPLGGEATGRNPTDRGKKGTKRSLLTEGKGIPIAIVSEGANRHDKKLLEATLGAAVIERPQPCKDHPQNLCLDKGYDYKDCPQTAERLGYLPHIRSRGEEKKEKQIHPGYKPRRWVVEVCHSWLNRFRKIPVRFEKKLETHLGLLQFACGYIVLKRAQIF
jgi:putative transposase